MRAVIYARYSSDNQREESIEAQVRACSEHIKSQGWLLCDTYIDRALSARSDQRPEFQQMIADAKMKKFDFVVIHKLDRFSRDRYDHAFYKRELKYAGVTLVSVLEKLDGSPESVMMEAMLEGFSEYYSRNLGREVMKGLKENALQCRHTGGIPPLGYDVDSNGKYVINEREAVAIRYIFEAYLNDVSYDKIGLWLKNEGVKSKRGGYIAKNSLHDILCNEKYSGTYIYNRSASKDALGKRNGHSNKSSNEIIKIEGGMPSIITKTTFEKAMIKMSSNKSGKHRAKEPYILSGLIFCGDCGSAMVGNSRGNSRTSSEQPKKYYECNAKKRTHECNMKAVGRDEIENSVLSYLENLLSKESIADISEWLTVNAKLYKKNLLTDLKVVKKELSTITKDVEKLLDKILDGFDSVAARQRLSDMEARKLQLEVKVTDMEISEQSSVPVAKLDVKKYLSQLKGIRKRDRHEQSQIIKQFVDRVVVYAASPDGGDRLFKISTKLDTLISNREDRKGDSLSPPRHTVVENRTNLVFSMVCAVFFLFFNRHKKHQNTLKYTLGVVKK